MSNKSICNYFIVRFLFLYNSRVKTSYDIFVQISKQSQLNKHCQLLIYLLKLRE